MAQAGTEILGNDPATCAIEWAYKELGEQIFNLVFAACGDHELAEDTAQEAFIKAWINFPKFDPKKGSLGAWLYSIARNAARDAWRHESRLPHVSLQTIEEDGDDPLHYACLSDSTKSNDPASRLLALEIKDWAFSTPDKRSPSTRAAFILRVFEGMEGPEIAEITGLKLHAIHNAMRRIREDLAAAWPGSGFCDDELSHQATGDSD